MNHTAELIHKLEEMLKNGTLPPEQLPLEDLKSAVCLEIQTQQMAYTDEQYLRVLGELDSFSSFFAEGTPDKKNAEIYLSGLLLALESISETTLSLAGRAYWESVHRDRLDDPEVQEIISYVDKHKSVRLLSYDFVDDYMKLPCESGIDPDSGMVYVMHRKRRMYFPRNYDEAHALDYYRVLLAEQDARSPHCYVQEGFGVRPGDVIVDCGAAEGFFALEHVDEASKIYLLEADPAWVEALKQTFRSETDRVSLIQAYVGDVSDGKDHIRLDDVLKDAVSAFIKMDIEGWEMEALSGADALLCGGGDLRCAICAYHREEDEREITGFLRERGFETTHSRGFMCPDWCSDALLKAQLRRGVVFGRKSS